MNDTRLEAKEDTVRKTERIARGNQFEYPSAAALTRDEISACIADTGIIPSVSEASEEDALFIAEALLGAGIPIVEISMNLPDALGIVSHLAKQAPKSIVGGGNVRNAAVARKCLDAGAKFISTDGLIPGVVEITSKENCVTVLGALTLTEVITIWEAGADFVRVMPCSAVGGPKYIRTLRSVAPQARLIAAGGVNQLTALNYMIAGSEALGLGKELIPTEAVELRQGPRIQELARRFLTAVDNGRAQAV